MKNLLLILVVLVFPSIVLGQTKPNYVGEWYQRSAQGKTPQQAAVFSRGTSDFVRTKKYNLNANSNQLNSILNTQPTLLNLVVPFGDKTYVLNLSRVAVTAIGFDVLTNNGKAAHNQSVQYRGIVDNNPQYIASLSLSADEVTGFFSTSEGNFTITKEGLQFIVYNQKDQPIPEGILCGTPDVTYQVTAPTAPVAGIACKAVNVYLECDYAFYQSKGSNISTLTNYVIAFFNQVATLYANENIAIQISEMFVWTSPDPYASLTTTSDVLNSFRTTRGSNYNGNLAHFLTTRNLGGGIAYVNTLCNKPYAFGVSMIYGTYNNAPAYSWTVECVTHELGHNLGSPHTQSCSWSTGPLDNCYAVEGTCAAGPTPVNGGTIMSYCHLTSIGINFNNGFGFYPGNLIRDKVMNATCITGGIYTPAPTSLSASNIMQTSATLNWIATPGAVNYSIQYKLDTAASWISAGTTTSTSTTISGLTAANNYVWSVRSDCSSFAANANFTTAAAAGCTVPTSLTTTNITQTAATLNWAAVTGATGYTVQYKTPAATTWTSLNTTTNSLGLSGLTVGTSYNWLVKTNCSQNSVATSFATSTITTPPPTTYICTVATGLTETNITSNSATLRWTGNSNAQSYTVRFREVGAISWINYNNVITTSQNVVLKRRRTYEWTVDTKCNNGTTSGVTAVKRFSSL
ncbi:M12 family metallo-peptidase [Flavobacterium sp.]|uniref:M12 family metallo-peptidase n=1 Tax=Flavobacterium sp. TaxID=239 RepID=UPI0025D49FBD|nr:M12 family metallo-peptidase [Flavobacterium sp.]